MRIATFHIAAEAQSADVIITALPAKQFGSAEANLNRWRGQVGLPPVADANSVERTKLTISGGEGLLFDFTGPDPATAQRLIVAQVNHGNSTFFFKLIGPAKLVEQQKTAFDSFLKSVEFAAE